MKKRFRNILAKSPKKNGLLLFTCAICITLTSGMLIGCSATKSNPPEEPAQADLDIANPGLEDHSGTQIDNSSIQADNSSTQVNNGSTQADPGDASGTDMPGDTPNKPVEDPIEQPLPTGENNYRSILLGESNFICTDLANKSLNINEIRQAVTDDDSVAVSAAKFAMTDMDGDGVEEVALLLQINGISDYGFEILHYQNGEIYGYTLSYRAFMNLKTDGTFLFSNGAADYGIGKMIFSETGCSVNDQAYSQSSYDPNNELTVQYFVNDESCSEEEFNDTINGQEQKSDVEWYDLSENNINAVL